ncbi:hypothetical protein MNBD_GAMMA19-425 [hydrothermal vent metagenome]|uniref:Uncharacterized protein n=1 Tax=hydrothermal vent metagenome TaxID=652676 RepID=A0A3B0ZWD5_9ZZZZ
MGEYLLIRVNRSSITVLSTVNTTLQPKETYYVMHQNLSHWPVCCLANPLLLTNAGLLSTIIENRLDRRINRRGKHLQRHSRLNTGPSFLIHLISDPITIFYFSS